MTIYYLYLKTHLKSNLRYLGQTTSNPYKYKGSGTDWKNHLKTHGNHVRTDILLETTDKEERNYWGRYYSIVWNVVFAVDDFGNKIYANRIPETGGGGAMTSKLAKEIANRPGAREKNSIRAKIAMNRADVKDKHSIAMQACAERISISKRNSQLFTFSHSSGIVEVCTRSKLIQKYHLTESNVSFLIKGIRKTHRGWKIVN